MEQQEARVAWDGMESGIKGGVRDRHVLDDHVELHEWEISYYVFICLYTSSVKSSQGAFKRSVTFAFVLFFCLFQILLSNDLLLVYKYNWFSYHIIFSEILLNSVNSFNGFVIVRFFGFSVWMIYKVLFLLFQFYVLLSFYFLVAPARNSRTKLNKIGKRENTCLVPGIKGTDLL